MDAGSISSETRGGFGSSSEENGQYHDASAPADSAKTSTNDNNCFMSIYYTKKWAQMGE